MVHLELWQPTELHSWMNRFWPPFVRELKPMRSWKASLQKLGRFEPGVKVAHSENSFQIHAFVPGLRRARARLIGQSLHIDCDFHQRWRGSNGLHYERRSTLSRRVELPYDTAPTLMKARFQGGLLTIDVPQGRQLLLPAANDKAELEFQITTNPERHSTVAARSIDAAVTICRKIIFRLRSGN